jgi:alpha-tubulin suppressor-like RCC1 family protein
LANGNTTETPTTSIKAMDSGIKNIFAGSQNSFLITTNGMLWGCGNNAGGILGDGTSTIRYSLTKILF